MSYVDGFIVPVPNAKKEAYRQMASEAWAMFKEYGATQHLECWGEDVPPGKVTDFQGAVKAKDDECIVFSWIVWPDKKTRDAGNAKMKSDPRMQNMKDMPFDGQRMIMGGFDVLFDATGAVEKSARPR
jgi:uncharacterized protein YbaA (DUF1428 family)